MVMVVLLIIYCISKLLRQTGFVPAPPKPIYVFQLVKMENGKVSSLV